MEKSLLEGFQGQIPRYGISAARQHIRQRDAVLNLFARRRCLYDRRVGSRLGVGLASPAGHENKLRDGME